MKVIVRVALAVLVIVVFGAGAAILLNLPPTKPPLLAGEKLLLVSDLRPNLTHGAVWLTCGPGGAGRLVIDARSKGDVAQRIRREGHVVDRTSITVAQRVRVDAPVTAAGMGWFDRYQSQFGADDAAKIRAAVGGGKVGQVKAQVLGHLFAFNITADPTDVAAFSARCPA